MRPPRFLDISENAAIQWPNVSARQAGSETNHFLLGAGRFFIRILGLEK